MRLKLMVLGLALFGCDDGGSSAQRDAQPVDAGPEDAALGDAGATDAASLDATVADAATGDAAVPPDVNMSSDAHPQNDFAFIQDRGPDHSVFIDRGVEPDMAPPAELQTRVAQAGGEVRFLDIAAAPSGGWLIAGQAANLDWVEGAARHRLDVQGIESRGGEALGVLIQVDAAFETIEDVWYFPGGAVGDISRVRVIDEQVYISGRRETADVQDTGYYIARLGGAPLQIEMVVNARGRPRRAGGFNGESAFRAIQPWDVGLDGRIIYGIGAEYDFDWAAIEAVDAQGERIVVPGWPAHWRTGGGEWHGDAAQYPDAAVDPLSYSAIVLKAGRRGSLRSLTPDDYTAELPDGNGGIKQGRWPDDYFFSGPCIPGGDCPGGPGYTGYRTSDKPTQRLGGIVIDRRNGDMYIGYSTQSRLPGGNPDFEPAVAAFDAEGRLKWWSRLYTETNDNSTPDQYVDGLAIDYAQDRLVVLARCHGNNVINLWAGNQIAANPEARGFQNQFTGNSGNIHISWLGGLDLDTGTLQASTYVAEPSEGLQGAQPFGADHPLAGQVNPNAGWANLNTTRCRPPKVDAAGRVFVVCRGRRSLTTPDAWQTMPAVGEGAGTWNEFARVYTPDLSQVVYSTLLTGEWDRETGQGGGNTRLNAVAPHANGVVVVGEMDGEGAPVRQTEPPAWAGQGTGLFGIFRLEPL